MISSSCLRIYFRISSSCCAQQQRKCICPSKMQTFRCLCDFSNLYLIEYCKRATDFIPNDKLLVYQWLLVYSIKIKIKYLFSPEPSNWTFRPCKTSFWFKQILTRLVSLLVEDRNHLATAVLNKLGIIWIYILLFPSISFTHFL